MWDYFYFFFSKMSWFLCQLFIECFVMTLKEGWYSGVSCMINGIKMIDSYDGFRLKYNTTFTFDYFVSI